ncbi:MAG TPA: alanine--tRNA ligase-related protein, partial [Pyrinomonadaceae bacterium]|nr:alanine--tRNA ligase-related protein [Pyrinomonadaceae bacterium]
MSVYEGLSESQQFACRVIADHARSTAFAIADGILPGNEGRNYVLRKIMRRAIYHGREHLGYKDAFFFKVCDFVVDQMGEAYPELIAQRDFIGKMVRLEEVRFGNTMTVGLRRLNEMIEAYKSNQIDFSKITSEKAASNRWLMPSAMSIAGLNDTFGLPVDLAYVVLAENRVYMQIDVTVDGYANVDKVNVENISEDKFRELISEATRQLQKQSGIGQTTRKSEISPLYSEILEKVGSNKFHGYDTTRLEESKVVAILNGEKKIDQLGEGEQGSVVLDETPFYAESGGQVGDSGLLVSVRPPEGGTPNTDTRATVADTYSPVAGLIIHKVTVERGSIKVGDKVTAVVD